jgi:3',5'-cyclic AMP phosphodiesterase CpdA
MMKKIAYLTDIHLDEDDTIKYGVDSRKNLLTILNDIRNSGVNEIIFGGDIGFHTAHEWFFNELKAVSIKLNITLGNHDKFNEVIEHFGKEYVSDKLNELLYTSEDTNYKYIFLDTSSSVFSESQLNWLDKELDTQKKPVIFMHHPVLYVKTIIDKLYSMKNREKVKQLLESRGKEITIFCGHLHTEDITIEGKITQYVTPASSYQAEKNEDEVVISNKVFGYRIIEFGDKIETGVILFSTPFEKNV